MVASVQIADFLRYQVVHLGDPVADMRFENAQWPSVQAERVAACRSASLHHPLDEGGSMIKDQFSYLSPRDFRAR